MPSVAPVTTAHWPYCLSSSCQVGFRPATGSEESELLNCQSLRIQSNLHQPRHACVYVDSIQYRAIPKCRHNDEYSHKCAHDTATHPEARKNRMHSPNSEPCQGGERTCMPNIGSGSPWQLQPGKGLRGVPSRRVRTKSAALEEKISSQLPPVPHSIQTHMAWDIYQKNILWTCPTCVSLGGRICKLNSLLQTLSKIGILPNTSSGQRDRQRTAFHSVCFSSTSKKGI